MAGADRAVYCGPAVLAEVCDCSVDEAERAVADVLGVEPQEIVGVKPADLEKAAAQLGARLISWLKFRDGGDRLQPTLEGLDHRWIVPGLHVVFIADPLHFLVLDYADDETVTLSDNETPPNSIEFYRFRTAPVKIVWQVSRRRTFAQVLDERCECYR